MLQVDAARHPVGWLWAQDAERPGPVGPERSTSCDPLLDQDSTLRDALSALLGSAVQEGVVVDGDGALLGTVSVETIASTLRQGADATV